MSSASTGSGRGVGGVRIGVLQVTPRGSVGVSNYAILLIRSRHNELTVLVRVVLQLK